MKSPETPSSQHLENQNLARLRTLDLELELEEMELRILDAVWSLERAIMDEMELVRELTVEIREWRADFHESKASPESF